MKSLNYQFAFALSTFPLAFTIFAPVPTTTAVSLIKPRYHYNPKPTPEIVQTTFLVKRDFSSQATTTSTYPGVIKKVDLVFQDDSVFTYPNPINTHLREFKQQDKLALQEYL
ncbi:hypothetical protein BB559_004690 [Furculomyces boomerangus]|uniref:Uncharacterized protein n=2 Tax=Harpellales TaxID=61421 RepID=A0A2T9YDH1_9FUNG|nr:hypothetical protein BB559_004690 [Furculomyces boomerangus]PWA01638.1 hypothetical protein BB558_002255 [Smittium angustum]